METNSYGILQAAVSAAEKAYEGDDFDLKWSFERDAAGTSHGKVLGVEGVEGGFWVDARVWVSDEELEPQIAEALKAELTQTLSPVSQEEPAIYIGPQQIRDHFDGQGGALERVVMSASYDQLLEIGKAVLSHDPIWEEFHNALVDAVREDLSDEIEVAEARDVIAGQVQHPDTKAVVDRAIQANASRRVPDPSPRVFDKVRHVSGTPEGKVMVDLDNGMYVVKWTASGIEERIHGSELVVTQRSAPPRPTLPLFDSKLEGAIKDIRTLADEINQLAMVLDAVLYQPQLMVVDRNQHRQTLRRIRERIAGLIEP